MEDLFSPFHCNVCLVLQRSSVHREENPKEVTGYKFSRLLTCSGCQLVRYCSTEHQKIDWPLHSSFCRAVSKLKRNLDNIQHPLQINWNCKSLPNDRKVLEEIIVIRKYELEKILQRPLKRYEGELISCPVICNICLKWQKLNIICPFCCCQAYCSKEHLLADAEEHKSSCLLLKLYYSPYKILKSIDYKFIPCLQNDKKHDMLNYDLKTLIESIFSVKISTKPFNDPEEYQLFNFAAEFSCITSILYCLQYCTEVIETNTKRFQLFIIGATVEASLWFQEIRTKLFFIQQPRYELLELYFIGPELQQTEMETEITYKFNDRNCCVKYYYRKDYIENFIQSNNLIQRTASLVVAFNCGFSEYVDENPSLSQDTWTNGLKALLQLTNIPIMFTSFTQLEAHDDYRILKKHVSDLKQFKTRLKLIENPYHDLRPLRNWYPNDKEQFYYRNGYIQCIEVSSS